MRAALGPPARDLATTRRAPSATRSLRRMPRALLDRVARAQMRRLARKGAFDGSDMAAPFGARMKSG